MSADVRVIGVYDADSTLRGELTYWVGARLGRRHCALCDITHGAFRERSAWQDCRAALPVPFVTFHRNDMPPSVQALEASLPAVFVETPAGVSILLDAEAVAACAGDAAALRDAIEAALDAQGIVSDD